MATASSKVPIWLDCDTGHDDAFAILLAAHHPKSRLLGVSTVHGNAPLVNTTHNTQAILAAFNVNHVPVFRGAAAPLKREASYATNYHGETGLGGVTLLPKPSGAPIAVPIESVASILLAQPAGTIHLVATGPLTNISKMLTIAPQLAEHLAGLSIMGGAVGGGYTDAPMENVEGQGKRIGNWTPFSEFNFQADPEAAHAVLSNMELASKTTLITLDLTHQARCVAGVQELLFGKSKHKQSDDGESQLPRVRELIREIVGFFAESYKEHSSMSDGPPMHDPIAVWAALRRDMFKDSPKERWDVNVDVQEGRYHAEKDPDNHAGQTVLSQARSGSGVFVPRGMDVNEFWEDIDRALNAAGG